MRKFVIIILVLLNSLFSKAQIAFQKTYGSSSGEYFETLAQTADGGFIAAGRTGGLGGADCYIVKTNYFGDTIWTRKYGTTQRDGPSSIQQTSDGGYIIAGHIQNNSTLNSRCFIIKTDSIGDIQWSKTSLSDGFAVYIHQTPDGGYMVGGTTYSNIFLLKTDSSGNVIWSKNYGGTLNDAGEAFKETNDGGYIIVGLTQSFGIGNNDIYLIKTDTSGNLQWSKTYGGSNTDVGLSVQQTLDSGYVIGGYTQSYGAGGFDMYLIKTNASGDVAWSKTYGGMSNDITYSVSQTFDGGFILCGSTNSFGGGLIDVLLIKTNSVGDALWTNTIGDSTFNYCYVVQQSTDEGFIAGGTSNNNAYLIKTDSNGYSGCNTSNPSVIISSPGTQTTSPTTTVNNSLMYTGNYAFTDNSGGVIATLCSNVGINEITKDNSFIIIPNPSDGNFVISFEETIMLGTITIVNLYGINICTENIFNASMKEINLENIPFGIYLVKIFDGKKSFSEKLIVE